MHFIDGGRGDHDATADGKIVDPGGPGVLSSFEATLDITKARVKLHKKTDKDQFEVNGSFELAAISDGIDILYEDVTVALGDFSETTFAEVWLNNLSVNANQTFSFSGNTFNNYLIAQYMNTLKDHERFDAIELQYIRKQTTRLPEQESSIETVNFQLSGIFIPYRGFEVQESGQGK